MNKYLVCFENRHKKKRQPQFLKDSLIFLEFFNPIRIGVTFFTRVISIFAFPNNWNKNGIVQKMYMTCIHIMFLKVKNVIQFKHFRYMTDIRENLSENLWLVTPKPREYF